MSVITADNGSLLEACCSVCGEHVPFSGAAAQAIRDARPKWYECPRCTGKSGHEDWLFSVEEDGETVRKEEK